MTLPVQTRAKIAFWLQGLGIAALAGCGTALMGVVKGMTAHDIFSMCQIQVFVHVGLYLSKPPADAGKKEQ